MNEKGGRRLPPDVMFTAYPGGFSDQCSRAASVSK